MRAKFGRGPTFVSKKGSLKFISRCLEIMMVVSSANLKFQTDEHPVMPPARSDNLNSNIYMVFFPERVKLHRRHSVFLSHPFFIHDFSCMFARYANGRCSLILSTRSYVTERQTLSSALHNSCWSSNGVV